MKKPNIVWSIFRKVIDSQNSFINKISKPTYLQNSCFLNCEQLLTVFRKNLKMNDLIYYNYVNKSG